ncbi:CoA transferase [Aromatoleum toluclasticum]|uniref:CaiB/BaiF CoA transferase family protein n=1 Tax=Aromatoleum toluclasticum TaxID=92003 RepID=UPI001D1931DD|nr:CoA transferase [Aromatoleum toluclasticum]MCC4118220.1 CoA transferase [Aromatoleum toluclasticum]
MSRALDDVVVLDLTRQFCASLSAAFLADFGARVIRLDLPPVRTSTDGHWNHEADLIHRNKESLAIDPASARGAALLHQLVAKADVIVTDWQRDELAALGMDYAGASALRPDIVFGRISGFGPQGPDADLPPIDELAAARTGMMPILPQPGQPPIYTGAGAMHATVMLAFGVVTALLHRRDSGEGQEVDVSLFGANMYAGALDIQAFLAIGEGDRFLNPISRMDVSNPMSGSLYPSADGRWVTLTMPDTDRWWPEFSTAVGIPADDPRFDTHDKRTETNRLELIRELEAAFGKQPGGHWRQVFQEKQMSADVIERFDYPANDPQVLANRYILELDHPSFGPVKSLGFPIFMSDSPARLDRLAPCVGQHGPQVLADLLGYPQEAIQQLRANRVLV